MENDPNLSHDTRLLVREINHPLIQRATYLRSEQDMDFRGRGNLHSFVIEVPPSQSWMRSASCIEEKMNSWLTSQLCQVNMVMAFDFNGVNQFGCRNGRKCRSQSVPRRVLGGFIGYWTESSIEDENFQPLDASLNWTLGNMASTFEIEEFKKDHPTIDTSIDMSLSFQ